MYVAITSPYLRDRGVTLRVGDCQAPRSAGGLLECNVISREDLTVPVQKRLDVELGEERISLIVDDPKCMGKRSKEIVLDREALFLWIEEWP